MFLQGILILLLFNTNYALPFDFPLRENIIENTCNFQIIRFNKNDVTCVDYGMNVNYCHHHIIPDEFIIHNEVGVNNKKNFIIKPYSVWSQSNINQKVLDFHYVFRCDGKYNEPSLLVNIVPTSEYDRNSKRQFIEVMYLLMALAVSVSLINICFTNLIENNSLHRRYNYKSNRIHRTYSE
tara:strand:- start:161 stop:703 length:543 start_codon:yes stop_codon:yes gene_type:complete